MRDLRGLAAARLAADDDDAVRHDDLPQRPHHPRRGQPHQQQAAVAERREVNAILTRSTVVDEIKMPWLARVQPGTVYL